MGLHQGALQKFWPDAQIWRSNRTSGVAELMPTFLSEASFPDNWEDGAKGTGEMWTSLPDTRFFFCWGDLRGSCCDWGSEVLGWCWFDFFVVVSLFFLVFAAEGVETTDLLPCGMRGERLGAMIEQNEEWQLKGRVNVLGCAGVRWCVRCVGDSDFYFARIGFWLREMTVDFVLCSGFFIGVFYVFV